ncbi:hypothetical protein IF2G_05382 [Cordyceps javanica]|nr:hypothetical protein IF2G_05382 [Cordyceps javanica]
MACNYASINRQDLPHHSTPTCHLHHLMIDRQFAQQTINTSAAISTQRTGWRTGRNVSPPINKRAAMQGTALCDEFIDSLPRSYSFFGTGFIHSAQLDPEIY